MELQNFLRAEGLEKLTQEYKIKANRHQKYPHLVCLKYSQIESIVLLAPAFDFKNYWAKNLNNLTSQSQKKAND